ncbi:transcriptional regulator with XRE-family HTH domain [Streptacidiphilus sp. MAP12-16]|uniref:hypothetical protein n=1 Tax=Streptacidiphilus sp. MAP12-16 TaxID=3156300 RepID=UPI003518F2A6
MAMGEDTPERRTLAQKIEYLRRHTAEDPDRPPSYPQIAEAMNASAGEGSITRQHLWKLATGHADNPSLRHLELLAEAFGVDPSYFASRSPDGLRQAVQAATVDGRRHPLGQLLDLLADYFGVDVAYFFDDEATNRINEEIKFLDAIAGGDIRSIALRSAGLSPQALAEINRQIDLARREEGLD